jgi:hypothetical protein
MLEGRSVVSGCEVLRRVSAAPRVGAMNLAIEHFILATQTRPLLFLQTSEEAPPHGAGRRLRGGLRPWFRAKRDYRRAPVRPRARYLCSNRFTNTQPPISAAIPAITPARAWP